MQITINTLPNEWSVTTKKMNSMGNQIDYFPNYKRAHEFYLQQCDNKNIDNVEETTGEEKNLMSGGIGYDYRIILEECI